MRRENSNKLFLWLIRHKRLIIGIATIILIFLMIFIVDFILLINKILAIGLLGTLLFVIAYSITFILRSYKLKMIFKGIDQNIRFTTSFFSIGISFFINEVTPAKLGDFAKIGIIKDQENIKLSESVGAIAIDRVLDLAILFSISCFALIYIYINNFNEGETMKILGLSLQFYLVIGALILIGFFIFLILLIYKTKFLINIINKISPKLGNLLRNFFNNFKEGIKRIKENKNELIYIIIIECILWIIEVIIGVMFFVFLLEDEYQINIIIIILAISITYFSKTFPLTPGGWGISENLGALFIYLFYPSIPYTLILSIFIIEHFYRSGFIFIYGGSSVIHYNFKLKDIECYKINLS